MNLHEFSQVSPTKKDLTAKFKYLLDEGLQYYEESSLALFDIKKFNKWSDDTIIEKIIPRSIKEITAHKEKKDYYVANAMCFLKTARQTFSEDFLNKFRKYRPRKNDDLLLNNYSELLSHLLLDASILLNSYEVLFLKKDETISKNPVIHPFQFYNVLKQSIFGQYSFHSYTDLEPDLPMAIIRQMIELRIRNAFGVVMTYNRRTQTYSPLSMGVIFDALDIQLKKDKDSISFPVPPYNLSRIYSWTNFFIHSGLRDYVWKSIASMYYLRGLMVGEKVGTTSSVNYGIKVSDGAIEAIHELVLDSIAPTCRICNQRCAKCHSEVEIIRTGDLDVFLSSQKMNHS